MTPKTKLIKTIYLYLVAAISLLFVTIGTGTLLNTGLKYFIFPDAEKKSYFDCNQPPPVLGAPDVSQYKNVATEDQKKQLDQLLDDYDSWKKNQSGDKCIIPARQNKIIDAVTMMIIALPILLIHWKLIRKNKEEKEV